MKYISHNLLMSLLLFVFSMPLIAQTDSQSIESADGYGQIQCQDYSFADFQKDLIPSHSATNKISSDSQSDYGSGSSNHDTDSLNTSFDEPMSGKLHRTRANTASSGDVKSKYDLVFRHNCDNDYGSVLSKHYPLE